MGGRKTETQTGDGEEERDISGVVMSGIEMSGLKCRGLKCRGLKCRGLKCRGLKCRGVEMSGVEMSNPLVMLQAERYETLNIVNLCLQFITIICNI